jgi:hypothetical protein
VAIPRLQQAWLYLYHQHQHKSGVDEINAIDSDSTADRLHHSSTVIPSVSQSYLSVLCEMTTLFLKTYLRCTAVVKPAVDDSSSQTSRIRSVKRGREAKDALDSGSDFDSCCDLDEEERSKKKDKKDHGSGKDSAINIEFDDDMTTNHKLKSIFACVPVLYPAGSGGSGFHGMECGDEDQDQDGSADEKTVSVQEQSTGDSGLLYHFRCSALSIQKHLLPFASHILAMSARCTSSAEKGTELAALGGREEVLWLAEVLWNVGVLLMKQQLCLIQPPSSPSSISSSSTHSSWSNQAHLPAPLPFEVSSFRAVRPSSSSVASDLSRFITGAEALELSQQLYHLAFECPVRHRDLTQNDDIAQKECEFDVDIMKRTVQTSATDTGELLSKECKAVLSAIAVRLDISCLLDTSTNTPILDSAVHTPSQMHGDNMSGISSITNVRLMQRNFLTIEKMLPALFERGLTEDHPLHKLYVMLSLAARLILGAHQWQNANIGTSAETSSSSPSFPMEDKCDGQDNGGPMQVCDVENAISSEDHVANEVSQVSPAESFLASHTSSLLALTPLDLLKCADTALSPEALGRSESVARGLLQLAMQLLVREPHPPYDLLGNLYRRLVELSPNKHNVSYGYH